MLSKTLTVGDAPRLGQHARFGIMAVARRWSDPTDQFIGARTFGIGQMRGILWTVALIAVVLLSVSLLSYYWLHWLAR